jgi:regulatory protein
MQVLSASPAPRTSPPQTSEMKRPTASLKVRALRWLAGREHSRAELRTKLLRLATHAKPNDKPDPTFNSTLNFDIGNDPGTGLGPASCGANEAASQADPGAVVDSLLDWLEQNGYLDNQRFVEAKVQARRDRYGPARIENELRQHGLRIDPALLGELKSGEFERAQSIWNKKFGAAAQDAAERMRQTRFLMARGYSADVVRRVVRGQAEDD